MLRAKDWMRGRCWDMAIVLSQELGLPLAGLFDANGDCHHAFALDEHTGEGVDARGRMCLAALSKGCGGALVRSLTREDIEKPGGWLGRPLDGSEYREALRFARATHLIGTAARAKAPVTRREDPARLTKEIIMSDTTYHITFEAIGFTQHLDACEQELHPEAALGYTEIAQKSGSLPAGVRAVVSGYITPDDHQDPSDAKVFASVTLRVAVPDEAAAELFAVPADLLTQIADLIPLQVDGLNPLALDSNSWEFTKADPTPGREGASKKPARRKP